MDKTANEQRARVFRTLFDGDEIDGKIYDLHGKVSGLDAATSGYLERTGRIEEITAKEAADDDTDEDFDDLSRADTDDSLDTAKADFAAGRIPDDLIDASKPADATDRLITKAALATIASNEAVAFKPADSKDDLAVAIMAARIKAEAANA